MNFLFLDESGTPSFKDLDTIFCVLGIDIDESNYREFTYEYNCLKRTYFSKLYRIESRTLATIQEKIKLYKKRECKEILTPNEFCYPHKKFLYKIIELCKKYSIKLFMVTAFKDKLHIKDPDWLLYPACIKILTRTYNTYLTNAKTKGIIIMDSRGDVLDDNMTYIQSSFLQWGKEGKLFDRVMDLPFFTASHLSVSLQIAHYFSYMATRHYYYGRYFQKKYAYLEPLWEKLSSLFQETPTGGEIIKWH